MVTIVRSGISTTVFTTYSCLGLQCRKAKLFSIGADVVLHVPTDQGGMSIPDYSAEVAEATCHESILGGQDSPVRHLGIPVAGELAQD